MEMPVLTKTLINRFLTNPEVNVRLINGFIKEATARVRYANGKYYEVRVQHVPDRLKVYGGKDEISFYYPESKYSGTIFKDIPEPLLTVVDKLKKEVVYTCDEIENIQDLMNKGLESFYNEMGIK